MTLTKALELINAILDANRGGYPGPYVDMLIIAKEAIERIIECRPLDHCIEEDLLPHETTPDNTRPGNQYIHTAYPGDELNV